MRTPPDITLSTDTATQIPETRPLSTHPPSDAARFLRASIAFLTIGVFLYLILYIATEHIVAQHTIRNRFYRINSASNQHYDYVILGASRAAVFDYEDMNEQLEEMTGSKIINLSVVGGGITVNKLLMDYFLSRHSTDAVVYFVDSFVFYSSEWNEARLNDTNLFNRAPFDPALVAAMLRNQVSYSVLLDYVSGFSKINNPDKFKADISDDEALRFNNTYRPVRQIDEQRIKYLYPGQIDGVISKKYFDEFEAFIQDLKSRGIRVILIKSPIPERVYRMLPYENEFDQVLNGIVESTDVEFHDLSLAVRDDRLFFNTDHLNRNGALYFAENFLRPILTQQRS